MEWNGTQDYSVPLVQVDPDERTDVWEEKGCEGRKLTSNQPMLAVGHSNETHKNCQTPSRKNDKPVHFSTQFC
jgi:hypothetical protein